jgi:hypothetical protein
MDRDGWIPSRRRLDFGEFARFAFELDHARCTHSHQPRSICEVGKVRRRGTRDLTVFSYKTRLPHPHGDDSATDCHMLLTSANNFVIPSACIAVSLHLATLVLLREPETPQPWAPCRALKSNPPARGCMHRRHRSYATACPSSFPRHLSQGSRRSPRDLVGHPTCVITSNPASLACTRATPF